MRFVEDRIADVRMLHLIQNKAISEKVSTMCGDAASTGLYEGWLVTAIPNATVGVLVVLVPGVGIEPTLSFRRKGF
jgi:hypothetical protein